MTPQLPETVIVDLNLYDLEIGDIISNFITEKFGYCNNGFSYEFKDDKLIITHIDWDTTE